MKMLLTCSFRLLLLVSPAQTDSEQVAEDCIQSHHEWSGIAACSLNRSQNDGHGSLDLWNGRQAIKTSHEMAKALQKLAHVEPVVVESHLAVDLPSRGGGFVLSSLLSLSHARQLDAEFIQSSLLADLIMILVTFVHLVMSVAGLGMPSSISLLEISRPRL